MERRIIHEKVNDYIKKGWRIKEGDEDCFLYCFISPRGNIYRDRDLGLNICCFCEDSEDEYCSGLHLEEDLAEQEEAEKFLELLKQLPCYNPISFYLSKFISFE